MQPPSSQFSQHQPRPLAPDSGDHLVQTFGRVGVVAVAGVVRMVGPGAPLDHILAVLDDIVDPIVVDHAQDLADQPFTARPVAEAQRRRAEIIVALVDQPVGVLACHARGRRGLCQRHVHAEAQSELVRAIGQWSQATWELLGVVTPFADLYRPAEIDDG